MLLPQIELLPGEQVNLENTQGHLRFVVSTGGRYVRVHIQPKDAYDLDIVKKQLDEALQTLRAPE